VRERLIERHADLLTAGEPVLVTGKVSFPQSDESDDFAGPPKEPTLLLDDVVPLSEIIRAETRAVTIRLRESDTRPSQLEELHGILREHPGNCPVQIVIEVDDGAEALLGLGRDLTVEPNDAMLASLERLFHAKVAELH
jgi:DNA polymerase-3 subunit alpha